MSRVACFACALVVVTCLLVEAKSKSLPKYILPHICKRSNPMLAMCVEKSIESLKPRLAKGMPELSFPPLEPLRLPELTLELDPKAVGIKGSRNVNAIAKDIHCHGASNFKVHQLQIDIDELVFNVDVEFPNLFCEAYYNVDARIANIPIKGHGPISGNGTNVRTMTLIRAGLIKGVGGIKQLNFTHVEVHVTNLEKPSIKIGNDFKGDTLLTEAFNILINANSKMFAKAFTPIFEITAAKIFLDISNAANSNIDFDEMFPA